MSVCIYVFIHTDTGINLHNMQMCIIYIYYIYTLHMYIYLILRDHAPVQKISMVETHGFQCPDSALNQEVFVEKETIGNIGNSRHARGLPYRYGSTSNVPSYWLTPLTNFSYAIIYLVLTSAQHDESTRGNLLNGWTAKDI